MGDPTRGDQASSDAQAAAEAQARADDQARAAQFSSSTTNPAGTGAPLTPQDAARAGAAIADATAEARRQRFDTTVAGGYFIGADGVPHDAHGNIVEKRDRIEVDTAASNERTIKAPDGTELDARSARAAGRALGIDAGEPGRPSGMDGVEAARLRAETGSQLAGLTASEAAIRNLQLPITATTEPASVEDVQSGAVETTVGPLDVGVAGGASPKAAEASRSVQRTRRE